MASLEGIMNRRKIACGRTAAEPAAVAAGVGASPALADGTGDVLATKNVNLNSELAGDICRFG